MSKYARENVAAASNGKAAVAVVRVAKNEVWILNYAPSWLGKSENAAQMRELCDRAVGKLGVH